MFWQFGAVAPQSFCRLSITVPGSVWLTVGSGSGAVATGAPGGAVAVRSAACAAGTVPGRTWKNSETLVGASMAFDALTAAVMAAVLVSVAKVAGSVVATTSTFHHSGTPLLRVPTTWSCDGIGTLATLLGDGLPGRAPAMRERSMVGGWSMHVAVAVHCVGGAFTNSGTGM